MKITRLAIVCSMILLAACQSAAPAAPTAAPQTTAAPSASAGALAGWKAFTSAQGGFSVMLPEEPTPQTESVDTLAGKVDTYLFMGTQGNNVYGVMYNDYPADALKQSATTPQAMLEASRDGAAKNINAKVISSKAITLGSNPGIDFVAELPAGDTLPTGATYHAQTYLVGNRLFQLVTIATEKGQEEMVSAFFESFKLTQ